MSTGREKDQKDYDLEALVKVIDTALTSDNPAVQNALRGLLLISTIVSAEHPDQAVRNGPFARLLEDYNNLARRLSRLEDEVTNVKNRMPPTTAGPFTPPSVVGPWIGTPTTGQPWTGTDPNRPTPSWFSTDGLTWSAGDDPNYRGARSFDFDLTKKDK